MNLEALKLIAVTNSDSVKQADVIVCLEGDEYLRPEKSVELFQQKMAPLILISGGVRGGEPFSIPPEKIEKYLLDKGMKKNNILIESVSQHTRGQAEEVMKIVKERQWKSIILVASAFHQPRAFLTFLKAMKEQNLMIKVFNAPALHSWFTPSSVQSTRMELLQKEIEKIEEYQKKGHVATLQEAFEYQKWKEQQL